MTPAEIQNHIKDSFGRLAAAGLARSPGNAAVLSHICLKFKSIASYKETVAAAETLGAVTRQMFKGKEISWCLLNEPLRGKDGLTLEWLELVEPQNETHPFDGVSSIGYTVPGLAEAVKIPSGEGKIIFRYQSAHAASLSKE
jgi:hypothetical protein